MTQTSRRIAVVAVALPLLVAGCSTSQVQAEPASVQTGVATSPSPSPSSPASTGTSGPDSFAIPATTAGEFGRVTRTTRTVRTVGATPMVAGQIYRLAAGCVRGGDGGRIVVDLHNVATGADRAKSVTTFSIACDGQTHTVDFQIAVPTRPSLSLSGTTAETRAYASVVSTGRKSTCGCG